MTPLSIVFFLLHSSPNRHRHRSRPLHRQCFFKLWPRTCEGGYELVSKLQGHLVSAQLVMWEWGWIKSGKQDRSTSSSASRWTTYVHKIWMSATPNCERKNNRSGSRDTFIGDQGRRSKLGSNKKQYARKTGGGQSAKVLYPMCLCKHWLRQMKQWCRPARSHFSRSRLIRRGGIKQVRCLPENIIEWAMVINKTIKQDTSLSRGFNIYAKCNARKTSLHTVSFKQHSSSPRPSFDSSIVSSVYSISVLP